MAGLERGVRPMGLWSMSTTLSKCSSPSMARWGAGLSVGAVEVAGGDRVQGVVDQGGLAGAGDPGDAAEGADRDGRVDAPQVVAAGPEDAQLARRGRAGSVAPGWRCAGRRRDSARSATWGWRRSRRRCPGRRPRPPWTPAPGPRSTTWSAARMASSSCSTTMTVLPMSRRWVRVRSRRALSRWCRPMEGSSRMYMTPTRPAPIWLARRMRWASPPERVSALRSRVR